MSSATSQPLDCDELVSPDFSLVDIQAIIQSYLSPICIDCSRDDIPAQEFAGNATLSPQEVTKTVTNTITSISRVPGTTMYESVSYITQTPYFEIERLTTVHKVMSIEPTGLPTTTVYSLPSGFEFTEVVMTSDTMTLWLCSVILAFCFGLLIATFGYEYRIKKDRQILDYGVISTTCETPSYQEPNVSGASLRTEPRNGCFTQGGGFHGGPQSSCNKLPTEDKQGRGEHSKSRYQATVEDDYDDPL